MTPERDERPGTQATHCEWCGAEYPAVAGAVGYRHRVLVIADEDCGSAALRDDLRGPERDERCDILIVAPALGPSESGAAPDDDPALAAATRRLESAVAALSADGIHAHGELGDRDPLRALDHGARTFHPDEVVVVTRPAGSSRWLEAGVVEAARRVHHVPIRHLVATGDPGRD
jgi:GABA permease